MKIEELRRSYKPKQVRLLLVGESAPASGKFFYDRSSMTTFTSRAFERAFNIKFEDTPSFLNFFQEQDCYLDDLSLIPVDKMKAGDREDALNKSIESLAIRLREYNPEVVAVALKKIEKHVIKAMNIAGICRPLYVLPFPGNGHQNKFIQGLCDILQSHLVGKF